MKRYLTSASLEYVHRTKKKVRKLMAERKLSQTKISKLTTIPRSSISRWLSPHHDDFMGLINRAARLPKPHLASMLNCYAEILGVRVG